jgi:lipopolysaccharide transport protein LptA
VYSTWAPTPPAARYVLDKGTLDLSSDAPGAPPHAETELISVDAPKISIVLDGPVVSASSPVKSVLKQQKSDDAKGAKSTTKTPTMLKKDQDVFVTATALEYDGNKSRASYTGDVRLTQGDTVIKAVSMVIDDKTGDLTAAGADANPVATTMVRLEEVEGKKPERTVSTAKAKDMKYEDAERRLAYTGGAHMIGVAGDMTADKIELYLKPSGDEIDRVEAYTKVTLKEKTGRVTTGSRLTYTAVDDRSVVVGTPVQVDEACGRRTTGQEITLRKSPDRVEVSGGESTRAQTAGTGASCP